MDKLSTISCLILLILILSACEKDKSDAVSLLDKDFRISGEMIFQDFLPAWKNEYVYDNNKIITRYSYRPDGQGSWMPGSRREYLYAADNVVEITYVFNSGLWVEESRNIKIYEGGHLVEHLYFQNAGGRTHPFWRNTFIYNNHKVTEKTEYLFEQGNWNPSYKEVYQYDGNNFREMFEYSYIENDWELIGKVNYEYNCGQLIKFIEYKYNYPGEAWEKSLKGEFDYYCSKPSSINYYDYIEGQWNQVEVVFFSYYDNGQLETYRWLKDDEVNSIEYTYEPGVGNYNFLYSNWLERKIFPSPTK